MLGTHSDLLTFTESHFFPTYFRGNWMLQRISEKLTDRIQAFLEENSFPRPVEVAQIRAGRMLRWSAISEVRKCLALFDALAEHHNKSAWLEKTPDNLHRLDILQAASPRINVIHIIREPSSVVSSLVKASKMWSYPFTPESASRKWLHDVRTSRHYRRKKHHAFVLYEDLVQNPDHVVRSLVARLGMDDSRLRLEDYRTVAARVIAPGETWKANNTRAVLTADRRDRSELPPDLAAKLNETYENISREVKSLPTYAGPSRV